jgi:hypothetical protein
MYRTTFQRWQSKNEEVLRYEEDHGIEKRWVITSPEYREARTMMAERRYRRAIDELERLVVQRLFELTKLGMNGVGKCDILLIHMSYTCLGYKLREKISKSLKTRQEAIQTALRTYNDAAAGLNPPRESLTWEKVVNAVTIADFDLLRDTRQDIRTLAWAQPSNREAMVLYFGIKRAKEEIVRLNVEIQRLLAFMRDEHVDYYRAIANTIIKNPTLARELSARWQYRNHIHERIVGHLIKTSSLPGFSGFLFPGNRIGRDLSLSEGIVLPDWATNMLNLRQIEVSYEEPVETSVDVPDVDTDIFIELLEDTRL